MKVILAGMSKTGTKTMNEALKILGYDVYDYLENFWFVGDGWIKQYKEGFRVEDMKQMYENVDAVVDTPCDIHWEKIFEAFPDSKVVLTTRDENSWFKSLDYQIDEFNGDILFRLIRTITYTGLRVQKYMYPTLAHLGSFRTFPMPYFYLKHGESLKRFKRKHEENVIQVVPKNQLLICQVSDGWKPLCDFLGVAVPDVPFPHKNKGAVVLNEMRRENTYMKKMQNELWISLSCLFVLFAFGVYHLFRIWAF